MYDDSVAQPFPIDVFPEVANPKHLVIVFEGIVNFEIQTRVDQYVVFDFKIMPKLFHPVDILNRDVRIFLNTKAFEGHRFSFVPFVNFIDFVDEHLFMITSKAKNGIAQMLELPDVIDDPFTIRASVDVVTEKEELILFAEFYFEQ